MFPEIFGNISKSLMSWESW